MNIFHDVLLVSRSAGFRQVVKQSLQGDNIVLINCDRCKEALVELKRNAPELVIIDLDMQDALLQELVSRIKENSLIPLILVAESVSHSSYGPIETENSGLRSADSRLTKQLSRSVGLAIELSGRRSLTTPGANQNPPSVNHP